MHRKQNGLILLCKYIYMMAYCASESMTTCTYEYAFIWFGHLGSHPRAHTSTRNRLLYACGCVRPLVHTFAPYIDPYMPTARGAHLCTNRRTRDFFERAHTYIRTSLRIRVRVHTRLQTRMCVPIASGVLRCARTSEALASVRRSRALARAARAWTSV